MPDARGNVQKDQDMSQKDELEMLTVSEKLALTSVVV
jgi:hypothetical protein